MAFGFLSSYFIYLAVVLIGYYFELKKAKKNSQPRSEVAGDQTPNTVTSLAEDLIKDGPFENPDIEISEIHADFDQNIHQKETPHKKLDANPLVTISDKSKQSDLSDQKM